MTPKSGLPDTNNYRYERKFVVSGLSTHEIESIISMHPAMFVEVYSPRFVNNLYFDSPGMNHYYDNIDGIVKRVKVRIRWYGELFGHVENPSLELKYKRGLVGRKVAFPLPQICIDGSLQKDPLLNILKQSDIPESLKFELVSLEFALLNRYWRKYFQSVDSRYRITLDTRLECYYVHGHSNTFLHKSIDLIDPVVELKCAQEEDDGVDQICQYFPFRMTKSSKYVSGVEGLYLW